MQAGSLCDQPLNEGVRSSAIDSKTLLDLLALSPELPVLICDAGGCVQNCSSAAEKILKRDDTQVAGRNFLELCDTSPHDNFAAFLSAARDGVVVRLASSGSQFTARARAAGPEAALYAVSLEPKSAPAQRSSPQPRLLLSVAEEISQFGCFRWDMTKDVLEWSDGLLNIFGIERNSFSGKGEAFFNRIHPDDRAGIGDAMAKAAGNSGHFESAERILRPNGEIRWLESRGRLKTDASGQPTELRGVCRDITDILQTTNELRRQVDALEQLTECAATMFSGSRPEEDWAPLLKQLGQIAGADVFKHCIQEDGSLLVAASETEPETASRQSVPMELLKALSDRCATNNSELCFTAEQLATDPVGVTLNNHGVRCYLGLPLLSDGKCIGTLAFASTKKDQFSAADLQLLKLVAQVVCAARARKLLEGLRERERLRYEEVAEHAGIIIWELDTNTGCFTFVSGSCEELSGYTPAEWCEPGFWEKQIYPEDLETSVSFCENATAEKRDHRFEYRMVGKDGRIIWFDNIVQVVLQDDEVVGLRGTLIDITERKSLEQQLLQAQKMEAIGNLTSGIAHDFNNLLTVIISSSELLEMLHSEAVSKDAHDLVRAIQDAGERASQLTHQLLLFSRSSPRQPQVVDINASIDDAREFLSRILGPSTQLSVNLQPDLPAVRIDPTHLQQTLLNLAVNARDAMPNGGRLTIQTSTTARPSSKTPPYTRSTDMASYVILLVSDTGDGIAECVRSRIFDPFFTTKPIGAGTGLGLSVVYGIVHAAGGFIEIDSEPGSGAEFRIYLPTTPTAATPPTVATVPDRPSGQETILVVEDEPAVIKIVVNSFEQAGYKVIGIPDPVEAVRFVSSSQHQIDLLVTDVSMPNLSGPCLVRAIQGTAQTPPFPVLFLSGNDQQLLEKRHGLSGDRENFLQKPFRVSELLEKARQLLASPPTHSSK